jgi:hypothetical protein
MLTFKGPPGHLSAGPAVKRATPGGYATLTGGRPHLRGGAGDSDKRRLSLTWGADGFPATRRAGSGQNGLNSRSSVSSTERLFVRPQQFRVRTACPGKLALVRPTLKVTKKKAPCGSGALDGEPRGWGAEGMPRPKP